MLADFLRISFLPVHRSNANTRCRCDGAGAGLVIVSVARVESIMVAFKVETFSMIQCLRIALPVICSV